MSEDGTRAAPPSGLTPDVQRVKEACALIAESLIETADGAVDTGRIWRNGTAKTIADRIRALDVSPDPPKAQHPSGDVERVVRAAQGALVESLAWCRRNGSHEPHYSTIAMADALDAALEVAARIADGHWPESGHVPCEGAVSCPMSISIMIRRLKSTYGTPPAAPEPGR